MFENKGQTGNVNELSNCVNTKKIKYEKGEFILNYGSKRKIIGIILNGKADLKKIDFKGNETILEKLSIGNIFSEMFINENDDSIYLIATEKTTVLFIEYHKIFKDCKQKCNYHNKIITNIMDMMMYNTSKLNNKINILSSRNTKDKIINYLKAEAKNGKKVTINFTFQQLADYLCVDRSAMMREIKNLINEKKIEKNGKTFTILKKN